MNDEIQKIKKEMAKLERKIEYANKGEDKKKYNKLGVDLNKKILRKNYLKKLNEVDPHK